MKSRAVVPALVVTALVWGAVAGAASAFPGDQRIIQGTIEWTPGPGGPRFVVVRGDDGQYYSADFSKVLTPPPALNRGDRVTVTGREGVSPHEILAANVASSGAVVPPPVAAQPGAPAPTPVPPTPTPPGVTAAPAPAPAPPAAPAQPADRLEGQVRAVSGNQVLLRTTGGRDVTVQMPASDLSEVLQPGDDLTVFGQRDGERRFVATGFIHVESPTTGSALPRQRR